MYIVYNVNVIDLLCIDDNLDLKNIFQASLGDDYLYEVGSSEQLHS